MTKIKQGHYIKLEGLSKEQYTKACKAWPKSFGTDIFPHGMSMQEAIDSSWGKHGFLGIDYTTKRLSFYAKGVHFGPDATLITYEELVGVETSEELKLLCSNCGWLTPSEDVLGSDDWVCPSCNGSNWEQHDDKENTRTASPEVGDMELKERFDDKCKEVLIQEKTIQSQQAEIERCRENDQLKLNVLVGKGEEIAELQSRNKELEGALADIINSEETMNPEVWEAAMNNANKALSSTKELTPKASAANEDGAKMGAEGLRLIDSFFDQGALGEGKIAEERRDNAYWLTELYDFLYSDENHDKYKPFDGGNSEAMSDAEAELHALYHRYMRAVPAGITQTLRFLCKDDQLPRVVKISVTECLDALIKWRKEEQKRMPLPPKPEGADHG